MFKSYSPERPKTQRGGRTVQAIRVRTSKYKARMHAYISLSRSVVDTAGWDGDNHVVLEWDFDELAARMSRVTPGRVADNAYQLQVTGGLKKTRKSTVVLRVPITQECWDLLECIGVPFDSYYFRYSKAEDAIYFSLPPAHKA